jgi:hypothetical protein
VTETPVATVTETHADLDERSSPAPSTIILLLLLCLIAKSVKEITQTNHQTNHQTKQYHCTLNNTQTIRYGTWKGVVPHCANNETQQPSHSDPMQLYDLAVDPFETTDVAAANADKVKEIIDMLITKDVSCACFQC